MSFENFELSEEILSGLHDVNYSKPTKLQEHVLPAILEGKNAVIKARSGMGKDGSYIIPIIEYLNNQKERPHTQALVLTPEVEHAQKVDEFVWAMGYHAGVQSISVDLDGDRKTQLEALEEGVDIVVANPGRIEELLGKGEFSFEHLKFIVVDDALRIAKMGIMDKVETFLSKFGEGKQKLLYSDRMDDKLWKFVDRYIPEPFIHGFDDSEQQKEKTSGKEESKQDAAGQTPEDGNGKTEKDEADQPIEKKRNVEPPALDGDIRQGYMLVPPRMKISTLTAHLDETPDDNVLIFTASKRGTDRLFRVIRKRNKGVRSIHERLPKGERERRYKAFKSGEYQFLLITDISARDIDFDHVKQVINYDVPNNVDEYRYRAGLVASGKAGRIVSLVSKQDRNDIEEISKQVGSTPKELPLPDPVQEKVEKRKKSTTKDRSQKRKKRSSNKKSGDKKSRGRSNKDQRDNRRRRKKKTGPELPRPSYDKLDGGRTGSRKEEEEKQGVLGFFKKLFS